MEPLDHNESRVARSEQMVNPVYLKRDIMFTIMPPTGESMPMRYKPDMTVDVLFKHACKKFNLDPESHYIIFNNEELKLTDTLKDLLVYQNSVMKIIKDRIPPKQPDIFVSVRIRDCRLGSVFSMTDTLWSILVKLLSTTSFDADTVPIVSYFKDEFIGENLLRKKRLRDMGIVEGTCLLKFHQVKQEDLDQRKLKEDDEALSTLESLDFKATTGAGADAGVKFVHFNLEDDDLDVENIHFIGERRALAFRLPDTSSPEETIQEEYFDLMVEEIHALVAEISRKSASRNQELYDEVRVQLKKIKALRTDFEETLIRVQFPDRACLQFLFFPEEKIADVKSFIRRFLRNPEEDFDVLAGEPKKHLEDNKTLAELKLVPCGLLFYDPKDRRFSSVDQYLMENITTVPYSIAKEASLMVRGESLDRFIMTIEEQDTLSRKSTGGFTSKYLRSSQTSGRMFSKGHDSKSHSRFQKKPSSFQRWSRGSVAAKGKSSDEEEDIDMPTASPRTKLVIDEMPEVIEKDEEETQDNEEQN